MADVNAIQAADNYRRASELQDQARASLIDALHRERKVVQIRHLAERAGVDESTLFAWLGGRRYAAHRPQP